jgi:hypothetical protein
MDHAIKQGVQKPITGVSMKKAIAAFSFALAISSLSQAAELCGVLESHAIQPRCVVGQPCPHWVKLQYSIRTEQNQVVDLETAKTEVLKDFGNYLGANVCVEGQEVGDKFEVTAIAPD